jgi:serine/threonine-protein kinase
VKPANLIFNHDTEQIVLTNVCLTSNLTLGIKQTQANLVSPEYSAPEQYHSEGKSSKATDVYGLAGTLYFLLTGNHPLPAPLHRVIPVGDWCELPSSVSPEIRQAILLGLQSDLRKRPTTIDDWLNLLPRENEDPAELVSSQSKGHIYNGPNFAKKHQPHFSSTLSESKVTNSPLLPLECLPKKSQSPEQNDSGDDVGGRKEVASPSVSAKRKKKSFPLGALVITSLVATSAGVGFGLALRLNLGEAGSTLLHRKQSFPPLPDMPQLEEQ